jgi:hypothetical protein
MAENPDAPQASAPIIQGITPPKALDITHGNIAENWKNYKQVWQNYAIIYRVAVFLHCIGPGALKVYNGCNLPTRQSAILWPAVIKNLTNLLSGR